MGVGVAEAVEDVLEDVVVVVVVDLFEDVVVVVRLVEVDVIVYTIFVVLVVVLHVFVSFFDEQLAVFVYVIVDVLPAEVVLDVHEHVVTGVSLVDVVTAGMAEISWNKEETRSRKGRAKRIGKVSARILSVGNRSEGR